MSDNNMPDLGEDAVSERVNEWLLNNKKEKSSERVKEWLLTKKKLVISVVVATIFFIIIFNLFCIPFIKYNNANNLFKQGNYASAITEFSQLKNYRDSKTKVLEAKYNIADELFKKKDYSSAIVKFEEISEYKDSKNRILDTKYNIAYDFFNNKNYAKALDGFKGILGYKDSKEKANQIERCNISASLTTKIEDGKITISVTSNLIDGAIISLSLLNEERFKATLSADTVLSSYVAIENGKAETTFTIPEKWNACNFKVLSDCAFNYSEHPQPQNVIDVYGIGGANLIGDLVKTDSKNAKYIGIPNKNISYPDDSSAYNAMNFRQTLKENGISEDLIPFYKLDQIVKQNSNSESIVIAYTSKGGFNETFNYYKKYLASRGNYRQQPFQGNIDMLFAPIYEAKRSISIIVLNGIKSDTGDINKTTVTIMLNSGSLYETSKLLR